MAQQDEENENVAAQLRQDAEDQQLRLMADQARQQAERHARDNAAAERLRTFGDDVPKGKRAAADYLRGEDTIAGPTGPTSSLFSGQMPEDQPQEGAPDGGQAEDR
jgi:hypothetical protein